jgi:prophage regulatory protein
VEKLRFMGAAEIQKRLGLSRARTYNIVSRRGFPEPYQTMAMGSIWLESDVEAWIAVHRPTISEEPEADA